MLSRPYNEVMLIACKVKKNLKLCHFVGDV